MINDSIGYHQNLATVIEFHFWKRNHQ